MHIRPALKGAALIAIGAALLPMGSRAGAQAAPTPAAAASVPGWNEFLDGLRDLPAKMLARLPEKDRNDPQVQQEIGRLALSAVAGASISALASDPDHPSFIPSLNNYITVGQPNADTNYRSVELTPGGSYRLRGRRGTMRQVRIAQAGPIPKQTPGTVNLGAKRWATHDLNALKVDKDGRYDVILSPARPAGYTGDWWQLDPVSNRLLLRMVGSNWGHEVEPTLSIERIDAPAVRPRPAAAILEAKLRAIPTAAGFIAPLLVGQVEKLRQEGFVNKLKGSDFANMGGLLGQYYYEGAYELADDEALIVEAKLPDKCLYRSILLTNEIYETTDWYNNHSSLNDTQAKADADGMLRVVISARDPGVPNWLDTAGYPKGAIQGRWTECSSQPVPTVRKVALADVRKSLPAGTPTVTAEQREQIVRDRRAALQQRPLW
ncbi:MAG: hypothetical protein ABW184_13540 [Sphingobium sp.]